MKRTFTFVAAWLISFLLGGCMAGYNVSEPSLVSDGLRVKNLLYLPSSIEPGRKYPAVVINHGGSDGVEFQTRGWARELAKDGFVVILPQFRGQGGSEGRFEFSGGEVDDSLAAFNFLKGLEYVDSGRIGMVGYSLGGLVTLNSIVREPGLKAAVLVSAISDPAAFFEDAFRGKPPGLQSQADRHRKETQERSPMGRLASINASVLILHGSLDTKVRPEQSGRLYDSLRACGKDVRVVYYPYIGHETMWFDAPMVETVEFLRKKLSPMSRSN